MFTIVRRHAFAHTVCALFWLASLAAAARADSPGARKAMIKGQVQTSERVPADATVVVLQWKSKKKLCDTCFGNTEGDGNYAIDDIPSGKYTLKAFDKAGRSKQLDEVVNDGDNSIDFVLPHTPATKRKGTLVGRLGTKIRGAEIKVSVCEDCPGIALLSTDEAGGFESTDLALGEEFWIEVKIEGKAIRPLDALLWPEYATFMILDDPKGVGQILALSADLPFPGRRFQDLITVIPNVKADNHSWVSINGSPSRPNYYIVDGADSLDASVSSGTTAIEKYTVSTNNFSAEFQPKLTALSPLSSNAFPASPNFISGKGGSNSFHGELDYGAGNDALDARNFFNIPGFETFRLQRGWANLGGPISKNHLFFFSSYEFFRKTEAPTFSSILVSQLSTLNRQLERLGLPAEDLRRFHTAYVNDNPIVRLDYEATSKHSLWTRYRFERDLKGKAIFGERGGVSDAPSSALDIASKTHLLEFQDSWTISSTVQNRAYYRYNRTSAGFDPVEPNEPSILIQGLALIGRAPNLTSGDGYSYSSHRFSDDLFLSRGQNSLKLGGQYTFENTSFRFASFESGRAIIPGLAALSSNPPRAELFEIGAGGTQVQYSFGSTGLYVRDDYRVIPQLTLNFGLRYDAEFPPSFLKKELDGWQPNIGLAWDITGKGTNVLRAGYGVFRSRLSQFPVGFQLLMGGLGLHIGLPSPVRLVTSFVGEQAATNAFNIFLSQRNAPAEPQMATTYDQSSQRALYQSADLSIMRNLGPRWSVEAGYTYLRGSRLLTQTNINLPPPVLIDGRPDFRNGALNPAFAQIYSYETAGRSSYHSGSVKLQGWKSYAPRGTLVFNATYTFSKSIDDAPSGSFEATPENVFDRRNDRAISSWSAMHYLFVYSSVEAPKPTRGPEWLSSAIGSLYLNDWLTVRSGLNFNVLTGFDTNHDGNPLTDRPLGVGRNTFLGQNFIRLDICFGSRIALSEKHQLRLQAKILNAFNRTNFDNYNTVLSRSNLSGLDPAIVSGRRGNPDFDFRRPHTSSGFGLATSALDPRRIQLEVKYFF
jgi:hypothetical protein